MLHGVCGGLPLWGVVETLEAAGNMEGRPLGVKSIEPHKGPIRDRRGCGCKGGLHRRRQGPNLTGGALGRCCSAELPASPSPPHQVFLRSASRRSSESGARVAVGHLWRRSSSHHHGGADCTVLAAPPRKVVAGELLACCTTAWPAGRPISSRRSTTSISGACCRCLGPRASRRHPTRRRTSPTCVLCCPRAPARCLRQRLEEQVPPTRGRSCRTLPCCYSLPFTAPELKAKGSCNWALCVVACNGG